MEVNIVSNKKDKKVQLEGILYALQIDKESLVVKLRGSKESSTTIYISLNLEMSSFQNRRIVVVTNESGTYTCELKNAHRAYDAHMFLYKDEYRIVRTENISLEVK